MAWDVTDCLPSGYLTCSQFGEIAGLKKRAAILALSNCHAGKPWRGHSLVVVAQRGRGGASGLSYLVRIDSLPPELRERAEAMFGTAEEEEAPAVMLPAPATGTEPAIVPAAPMVLPAVSAGAVATAKRWEWIMEIIRPALALPKGSRERAAVIEELTRHTFLTPSGRRKQFGESTIREWILRYEKKGLAGLERKGRSDRGGSRVLVSRVWDKGVPFSDKVKRSIADRLIVYVQKVWQKMGGGKGRCSNKTGGGWNNCCRMATKELVKMTSKAGLDLPLEEMISLCDVPRTFVEAHRNHAIIALKNKDAKGFFDTALPRTRRTRAGMMPMDLVVGDVHHVDIYLKRGDGTLFTPKLIAWCDIATNRIFYTLVFVDKGKGIRQEDVIKSFIDLTQHSEWGFPQALYLDNGGEYSKLGFVDDAMKLTHLAQRQNFRVAMVDDDAAVKSIVRQAKSARRSMVINAQPYNAPAKPIEGIFAVLEGGPLALIDGWIGGNRMTAKTKNVGKEPTPFPGTEEQFREAFATAMDYYHTNQQSGSLKGKSPRETFTEAVNSGWQRTDVDVMSLHAVFTIEKIKTVKQGEFQHGNIMYRADELFCLLPGTKVIIRVPLVGDKERIPVLKDDGSFLCIATPAPQYGYFDPAGAKDKSRRISAQNKALRAMAHDDELDPLTEMREAADLHPPAPIPESGGMIRLSAEMHDIAQAAKQLPAQHAKKRADEDDDFRKRSELLARLAASKQDVA